MKKLLLFFCLLPSLVFAQLELPYSVKMVNPRPVDYFYLESDGTPYENTAEVITAIPSSLRYQGMTVNIAGVKYSFKDGITDGDLVADFDSDSGSYWKTTGTTTLTGNTTIDAGSGNNLTFQTAGAGFLTLISPIITFDGSAIATQGFNVQESTIGNPSLTVTTLTTNDDAAYQIFQGRVATTDATPTTIFTLPIPLDNTVYFSATIVARRTGGSAGSAGDGAAYHWEQVYHNVGGTVTQIGSLGSWFEKESNTNWNFQTSISGTNVLIQVIGAANNNITWHLSELKVSKVSN